MLAMDGPAESQARPCGVGTNLFCSPVQGCLEGVAGDLEAETRVVDRSLGALISGVGSAPDL